MEQGPSAAAALAGLTPSCSRGAMAAAKWALSCALLGGVVSSGAAWIAQAGEPERREENAAPAPTVVRAQKPRSEPEPALDLDDPEIAVPEAQQPAVGAARARAFPPADDLREQRLLIERARQKLSARRPAEALALLDEYRSRFDRPVFHQESIVLRVEALMMSGQTARARSIAQVFLDAHPESPLARRVRSLVGL
jgi:hypothetical protein